MSLHQYKAAVYEGLYLQPAALSKPAGQTCLLALCWQSIPSRQFQCTESYHGRSTANAGNHPASISASITHIADSWPGLEEQELPVSFPTHISSLLHSLAGTSKAHRYHGVWTRIQTNHIACLLKIQRIPSAASELADQFCTVILLCQVRHVVQAVNTTLGALQKPTLQLAR